MIDGSDGVEVTAALDDSAVAGQRDGVTATPTFLLGKTGGELSRLEITSLGPEEFRAAIDQLLAGE
jgi:hypothetical protein